MNFKILQVFNKYLEKGGEELVVNQLTIKLKQRYQLKNCLFDSAQWTGDQAPSKLRQLKDFFYNKESAVEFKRAFKEGDCDIALFHNIYPIGSPSLYHVAKEENIPVVQYIHNFRPFSVGGTLWNKGKVYEQSLRQDFLAEALSGSWQGSRLKSLLMMLLLKRLHQSGWLDNVKAWIAPSEFIKDKFVEAGIPKNKIHMLRYDWETMSVMPLRKDKNFYLFLARFDDEKGVNEVLDAWDIIYANNSNGSILKIAGDGKLKHTVINRALKNPLIDYVGYVMTNAKAELFQNCRAVLMPSKVWESLGLIVYEAYDYGKGVIASANGGLAEIVEHGNTGLVLSEVTGQSIAEAIKQYENLSQEQRLAMGDNGREWLLREACPKKWQQEFEKVITLALENY